MYIFAVLLCYIPDRLLMVAASNDGAERMLRLREMLPTSSDTHSRVTGDDRIDASLPVESRDVPQISYQSFFDIRPPEAGAFRQYAKQIPWEIQ